MTKWDLSASTYCKIMTSHLALLPSSSCVFLARTEHNWTKEWHWGRIHIVTPHLLNECDWKSKHIPWEHLVHHKVAIPWSIHCFIITFTLYETIIYILNIMLYWRRPETNIWDHKLIRKLFIEFINQVRSRVIFSYAYMQLNFFLKPAAVTKNAGVRHFCSGFIFRHDNSIHNSHGQSQQKWLTTQLT